MKLPVPLPAVGNVEAVRKWRFARIERIDRNRTDADMAITVRFADGTTRQVVGPRDPLAQLGQACGWLRVETQTVAGRADFVERMVALDVDENNRIIAIMSMEPFDRDRARLRRAFGP